MVVVVLIRALHQIIAAYVLRATVCCCVVLACMLTCISSSKTKKEKKTGRQGGRGPCGHKNTVVSNYISRGQLKCDGTRAEIRFRLSAKRASPFKSACASVQSTTDSRGVRINDSNAGYTMFRGSVKGTGYPIHSPVSLSLPLLSITVCHHISIGVNHAIQLTHSRSGLYTTHWVTLCYEYDRGYASSCGIWAGCMGLGQSARWRLTLFLFGGNLQRY